MSRRHWPRQAVPPLTLAAGLSPALWWWSPLAGALALPVAGLLGFVGVAVARQEWASRDRRAEAEEYFARMGAREPAPSALAVEAGAAGELPARAGRVAR